MFLALAQRNLWLILSCCCFLSPQTSCRTFLMLLVQRRLGRSRGTRNTKGVGCLWSMVHGGILPWGIVLHRTLSTHPPAGDVCPSLESLGELPRHHGSESPLQSREWPPQPLVKVVSPGSQLSLEEANAPPILHQTRPYCLYCGVRDRSASSGPWAESWRASQQWLCSPWHRYGLRWPGPVTGWQLRPSHGARS